MARKLKDAPVFRCDDPDYERAIEQDREAQRIARETRGMELKRGSGYNDDAAAYIASERRYHDPAREARRIGRPTVAPWAQPSEAFREKLEKIEEWFDPNAVER